MIKINDPAVLKIRIKDNDEPLVDILKKYPELFYDQSRKNVYKYATANCRLRVSVVKRLTVAQKLLPKGIVFKIKEGFRPMAVQKKVFNEHMTYLRKKWPGKSKTFLKAKAVEYVAPLDIVPPHTTGGAVDLTLMTINGKELDMGQRINDSGSAGLTNAKNISAKAKKNHKILIKAMTKVGFVNYPFEWWHWSYGDRYWAFIKKQHHSIYGSLEK